MAIDKNVHVSGNGPNSVGKKYADIIACVCVVYGQGIWIGFHVNTNDNSREKTRIYLNYHPPRVIRSYSVCE